MGYVVIDVEADRSQEALFKLKEIEGTTVPSTSLIIELDISKNKRLSLWEPLVFGLS